VGGDSVRITIEDIKGNKRTKAADRSWLDNEFGKSIKEEENQDFELEKKVKQQEEEKFLLDHIVEVVQNENGPEIEAKEEREKDRHLFYCDYAEDSDDEGDNRHNKAKEKAAVPYDWRKIELVDDPLHEHTVFSIVPQSHHTPSNYISLHNTKAKGWSRIRKIL
jgi:hypothetical protein